MSLLDEAMESCTILNKATSADGYGGYVVNWQDGAQFNAAIVLIHRSKDGGKAGCHKPVYRNYRESDESSVP